MRFPRSSRMEGDRGGREVALDFLVDAAVGHAGGDANGVLDGVRIGAAVGDDADAADAEQGRAAIFGIVDFAAEVGVGAAGEDVADLGGEGALEGFLELAGDQYGDALADFEGDIADEAV